MSFLSMRPAARVSAILALAFLSVAFVVACDDGDDDGEPAVDTPAATAEASGEGRPVEGGLGNIFWRTEDGFQSVVAGEPYKVVLRVTNGYDEDTLPIVAERSDGEGAVEFDATRAMPDESEGEGSFYTFELLLPEPGSWNVLVTADDSVAFPIEVQPATETAQ